MRTWLTALMLAGCAGGGSHSDAGAPVVCQSGQRWLLADQPSVVMYPGRSCNTCHAERQLFLFAIAGTVYAAQHDPDDCFGVPGATVVITGADGQIVSLVSNVSGNFSMDVTDGTVALPYHAKVVTDGGIHAMGTAQTSGDCNGCHSARGDNDAPGRILVP